VLSYISAGQQCILLALLSPEDEGSTTPSNRINLEKLTGHQLAKKLTGHQLAKKLTGHQLAEKYPAFYGTRRFITASTSDHNLPLS
jgi:hypothetical protein